ncbi:hypothetical protein FCV62_03810 [Vibrio kanaloae]|uniref:hypothetical protein n=1 Tax=Vibrio kanaloae TaxID=170673 RepID=UPI0010BEF44D|nr:hypothetical protein [Vibrio kanaloae]TKF81179.1 hypothetical protein FCV62_03810 [Vibrio kanaloae]
MNFGNVFIRLCSSVFLMLLGGTLSYAQPDVPENLMLKSDSSIESYARFIQKFKVCGDKTNRANNPYPINDWLLSLPLRKQSSVVMYLLSYAEYQCYEVELNEMIHTMKSNQDQRAIDILESEGWLSKPLYGQYSFTNKKDLELTKNDHDALSLLLNMKYLPFDLIGMGELLRSLREK